MDYSPYNPYGSYDYGMQNQAQGQGYATQGQRPRQQPQQLPQTAQEVFICRPVASREEALATPTDYVRPILMPDLGHGMIYMKWFNERTGASDFLDFGRIKVEQPQPQALPQYATVEELNALREELEKLKKPTGGKGKKNDEE